MAKAAKKGKALETKTAAVSTSKRAGYKRKSNRRVNVLEAQLKRVARKAMNKAAYTKSSV